MGKKRYSISGSMRPRGRTAFRAGLRHGWFGPSTLSDNRGFATFVETRSLQHANAQYRRLKIADRQMDLRETGRPARVLKYGTDQ